MFITECLHYAILIGTKFNIGIKYHMDEFAQIWRTDKLPSEKKRSFQRACSGVCWVPTLNRVAYVGYDQTRSGLT